MIRRKSIGICIISILSIITLYRCFEGLATTPIERWDEQTNLSVIEDTRKDKTFPVLMLSGKPFFEKPPLWYFLAITIANLGFNTLLSFRLISVFSGMVIIFLIVLLAWRWWGTLSGIITWLMLLTTNQLFIKNAGGIFSTHTFRSADLDALQIVFILLTFASFIYIHKLKYSALFIGIFSALAVLAKGPLGLVPLCISTILIRKENKMSKQSIRRAWIIFTILTLPWYIFMSFNFGTAFISSNIFYHVGLRSIFPIEGHINPFWYYALVILNQKISLVGITLSFSILWSLNQRKIYNDLRLRYCLIYTLIFFLIPTLVQTKLGWYILPFYPFAALMIGKIISTITREYIV